MANGGEYYYGIGLNTAGLARGVDQAKRMFQGLGNTATEAGREADEAIDKLKGSLMSLAAGVSLTQLAKKIVDVRGEVQQLEIAFETMLGSKAKADKLMSEMMTLAAATPFGLQDVTGAAKQLLAFGSTAEEVAKEITMLGDIAAGMSIPLNDMIYLYGTTRTQGRLFTQDLRQFMGRGIPLAEELAKQFGVTKDKVGELVTAGKVGFPEVQKALEAMTSEGGKFGGLMEKQAQSVAGQVSALEDAIYQMFNEIGESSDGFISAVLSGASWVVEHYEPILSILSKLIIAYGAYKAALIANVAIEKTIAAAKLAQRLYTMVTACKTAAQAWRVLNTAMKSNVIGLIASVIATIAAVIWDMCSATDEATDSTEALSRELGELEQAERDEYIEVQKLAYEYEHVAKTEEERLEVLKKLKDINPDIVDGVDALSGAYDQLTKNVEAYCEQQLKSIQLASLTDKQNDALKRQGEAMAEEAAILANLPYQLIDLRAKINSGVFDWSDIKLEYVGGREVDVTDKMKKEVFKKVKDYLNAASITPENAEALARQVHEMSIGGGSYYNDEGNLVNSYVYALRDSDSFGGGYNFKKTLIQLNNAREQAEEAQKDLEIILRDMPDILKMLGLDENPFEGEGGDGADAAMKYVDALRAAREAYLREQREFAAVKKNPEATEAEYFTAEEELKTAKEAYEKLGGVTKQATNEAEKQRKEAAKRMQQLEYDSQQAIIDIMADGTDKKLAQIDLDYKKRMDTIAELEAELLAKQGSLTEEQAAMFKNIRTGAANDYANAANEALFGDTDEAAKAAFDKLKADKKAWNEYLAEYGTFQERWKALTIKYNEEIAAAQNAAESKRLEAERDAILAEYEVQAEGYAKELAGKTIAQLNTMVAELKAQVEAKQQAFDALDSSDSAAAQQYREEINKLNAQIKALEAQLKKAQGAADSGDWESASLVMQGISDNAKEAAEALSSANEAAAAMLGNLADCADMATGLVSAIKMLQTASTAAQGVFAIFSIGIQLISKISQIQSDNAEAARRATEAAEDYHTALKRINDETERMSHTTIFGTDTFGQAVTNIKIATGLMNDLADIYATIQDKEWNMHNLGLGAAEYSKAQREYIAEINAMDAALVADMRSNAQKFFGSKKNIVAVDLASFYTEDGKLKLDELKAWFEQYSEYLSAEQKRLVEGLIDGWQEYYDSMDASRDYLTSIFGELGSEINDAIVDAFANGTDAAVAFGDVAGKVMENLIKQIGYTAYIAPILSKAMADVEALNGQNLTPEGYLNELMSIVGDALKGAEAGLDAYNDYLDRADRMAEEQGLNTFNGERSAEAKGITQASQDSVDEMNGRLTVIQSHTFSLVEGQKRLIVDSTQVLKHLAGIEVNTAELKQMRQDISLMRSDISDMATRGIITR